jgi:hypothetical protein
MYTLTLLMYNEVAYTYSLYYLCACLLHTQTVIDYLGKVLSVLYLLYIRWCITAIVYVPFRVETHN